jgi:hypothetical protein
VQRERACELLKVLQVRLLRSTRGEPSARIRKTRAGPDQVGARGLPGPLRRPAGRRPAALRWPAALPRAGRRLMRQSGLLGRAAKQWRRPPSPARPPRPERTGSGGTLCAKAEQPQDCRRRVKLERRLHGRQGHRGHHLGSQVIRDTRSSKTPCWHPIGERAAETITASGTGLPDQQQSGPQTLFPPEAQRLEISRRLSACLPKHLLRMTRKRRRI